jgi:DNA-binding LytR/AlgR family response regulator
MNCIIIDDDGMSRNAVKHLVCQIPYLNLVGVCATPMEAITVLNSNKIDLMLLDIEMPDMTGLELLKGLQKPPLTILITTKKEYALEAFEYNVVDYLLKPISLERFFKAIAKAKKNHDTAHLANDPQGNSHFFIKSSGTLIKINVNEILWIEALGDYITINTSLNKRFTIHSTMKMIESKLASDKFVRVHRSFIVAIDSISSIDDNVVVIGKQLIPVGAVYKENLTKHLNLL